MEAPGSSPGKLQDRTSGDTIQDEGRKDGAATGMRERSHGRIHLPWSEDTMAEQSGESSRSRIPLEPGVAIVWSCHDTRSKWKARRAADWEELMEWKFLTACYSPSVEQLYERFVGMEMWGVALMKVSVLGAGLGTAKHWQPCPHLYPNWWSGDVSAPFRSKGGLYCPGRLGLHPLLGQSMNYGKDGDKT